MPKETLNLSVEQLLELLPHIVGVGSRLYGFRIYKRHQTRWNVGYTNDNELDKFVHINPTLQEALQAVYNDLKTNGYL